MPRYLTKSKFKLALECPSKLFYTGRSEYANQKIADSFLAALAEGGFQVGALAKCYFPEGILVETPNDETAVEITAQYLERGHRYRKHNKTVFGRPDFTFKSKKIAIFVDSEFWHGKDWERRKNDHKSNKEFWLKKIERNIERDKEVNSQLASEGWKVIRFSGKEIREVRRKRSELRL